jgi:hypothetical protein
MMVSMVDIVNVVINKKSGPYVVSRVGSCKCGEVK